MEIGQELYNSLDNGWCDCVDDIVYVKHNYVLHILKYKVALHFSDDKVGLDTCYITLSPTENGFTSKEIVIGINNIFDKNENIKYHLFELLQKFIELDEMNNVSKHYVTEKFIANN